MKHILSVLVNNNSGVLSHVAGLFTRRGYNIDSLSVGVTNNPEQSIITLVVKEDEIKIRQIQYQLYKLSDVIEIRELSGQDSLQRELLLIVVKSNSKNRQEILTLADVFKATIVDMTEDLIMIEIVGIPRRITSFLKAYSKFEIIEMARTGSIALPFPSALEQKKDM